MAKEPLYPHVPKSKQSTKSTLRDDVRESAARLAEEAGRLQHEVERLRGKIYPKFPNVSVLDKECSDAIDALSDVAVYLHRIGAGGNPGA